MARRQNTGTREQLDEAELATLHAVRVGISWPEISGRTVPYFGRSVKPPFEAICQALEPAAYQPPNYDGSRQTPEEWRSEADAGWLKHREELFRPIQAEFDRLMESGQLKVFKRPRVSREPLGKEAILDERIGYEMAVGRFFREASWADLAEQYAPEGGYLGSPIEKAGQKKKRANQIRMRVDQILEGLRLTGK